MDSFKAQIASNSLHIHRLEKLFLENESHFYEVVSYMPLLVTVSYVNSLDYKYCNDAIEGLTHLDRGLIMEQGWSLIQDHIHPENLKYQSPLLKQFRQNNGSEVLTYYQYVRKAGHNDYYWIQTYKKFLNDKHYLSLYHDLRQWEKLSPILSNYLGEIALSPIAYLRYQSLTSREREILKLVAAGRSTKEISERLFISQLTVKTHRQRILRKLNVKNLAELIRFSFAMEMVIR